MKKYLKPLKQIEEANLLFDIQDYEIAILNIVASAHFSKQTITVGDIIHQRKIASPATLHAGIKLLIKKKFLLTKVNKADRRIKEVLITKLAITYYKRLDQAMLNC